MARPKVSPRKMSGNPMARDPELATTTNDDDDKNGAGSFAIASKGPRRVASKEAFKLKKQQVEDAAKIEEAEHGQQILETEGQAAYNI